MGGGAVEAGQAQPVDRAVPTHQGARTAIRQERVLGDRRVTHQWRPSGPGCSPQAGFSLVGGVGAHRQRLFAASWLPRGRRMGRAATVTALRSCALRIVAGRADGLAFWIDRRVQGQTDGADNAVRPQSVAGRDHRCSRRIRPVISLGSGVSTARRSTRCASDGEVPVGRERARKRDGVPVSELVRSPRSRRTCAVRSSVGPLLLDGSPSTGESPGS